MKRLLTIILTILLVFQSCIVPVASAKTLGTPLGAGGDSGVPSVLLNGSVSLYNSPVTVQYGQAITIKVNNDEATELEFYYQTSNIEDMWWSLEDGLALMTPGKYYIGYNCWIGDDMIDNTLGSIYGFNVIKGQAKAPENPVISTFPVISWNASTQTVYNYSLAADTVTDYTIELYLDGTLTKTLTSTTTSLDLSDNISGLYGEFTFKVKANVSNENTYYTSSEYSSLSASYNNDDINPVIDSVSSDDTHKKVVIKTTDHETGITAYAFSNSNSTEGLSWIDVTRTPNITQVFEKELTQSETLYFFAKDTKGNIAISDSIIVSQVTLNYNSPKENENYYLVGNTDVLSLDGTITRKGYTFKGWYPDSEFSGNAITEVDGDGYATDKNAYVSWEMDGTTVEITPYNNKTYDGLTHNITATFNGEYDEGTLEWQWYKHEISDETKLEGETGSTLSVKNVADSDNYFAVATYKLEGKTYTSNSEAAIVLINKAKLTVKADNKNCDYGKTIDEYTYKITGFLGGDLVDIVTISDEEISCEYEVWDDIGGYDIKIDLDKFEAENYSFVKNEGKLTVNPMDVNSLDSAVTITLDCEEYVYDTNAKTPTLTIMDGTREIPYTNYTIEYKDNTNAGTATVKVTFKANYKNEIEKNYTIEKAEPTVTLIISDFKYDSLSHTPKVNYSTSYKSDGAVTYYYNGVQAAHPINVGSYSVYAVISETDNFKELTTDTVDFEIKKREIVLTANSASKVYDDTPLVESGYVESGDGFVGTDAFLNITVTGSQTEVGTSNNVVTYELTSATNVSNYDIKTEDGTLKVSETKLKKPVNVQFNKNDPANARWLSVNCVRGNVTYTVELFDGESTIATVTTTNTYYDFSEIIHEYLEEKKEAKSFSFRVKASCDNLNIADSDFSAYSDDIYSIRLVIDKAEQISVTIDKKDFEDEYFMLAHETISIDAKTSNGILFKTNIYSCDESFISIADVTKESTTLSTSDLSAVNNNVELKINYSYDYPHISTFKASNYTEEDGYLEKVVFTLKGYSNFKLKGWALTKSTNSSSITEWNEPTTESTLNETVDVTEAGTYYLYLKDERDQITSSISVVIFSVSFVATGATGEMPTVLKVQGTTPTLPLNKFEKEGYGFQNWINSDGTLSFIDGSEYSTNANETLTAVWSQAQYSYTVNHFYEKTDGTYSTTPDNSVSYLGFYNEEISNSLSKVLIEKTGFKIVSYGEEPTSIKITEQNMVLNIYYERLTYTFKYTYTDPYDSSTVTFASVDYKYGQDISTQDIPNTNEGGDFEGYHFIGWTYPGSGEKPATMPANNVTATGYFSATDKAYYVNFFVQNTDGSFTLKTTQTKYGLCDSELDSLSTYAIHGYEGHSFAGGNVTYGEAGLIDKDVEYEDSITGTIKGKVAEATNINLYYTSNSYSITLKIYTTDTNLKVYEKTYNDILYGTPIDHTFYETDNGVISDAWCNEYHNIYRLSALKDWNCGSVPGTMRGMNITITRYIYPKKTTPRTFSASVYLETLTEGVYADPITLYYLASDSDGTALSYVTIGDDRSYNINYYSNFYKKYYFTQYYELDTDNPNNVLELTADDDLEFQDELKVYLKRKSLPQTIDYYFDNDGETTKIASVVRYERWGTTMGLELLAYFDGGSFTGDGVVTYTNSEYAGVDFRNYEVEDVVKGCLVEYACSSSIGNGSYGTGRTRIIKAEDLTKNYTIPMGQNGATVAVYYHYIADEKIFNAIPIYFKSSLLYATEQEKQTTPLTYNYSGTDYNIYACDKTYIYNWSFGEAGDSEYPAAGRYNGEYTYSTIKDGFTEITINSKTYYIDGNNRLYNIITDPAYPILYEKNIQGASYPGNGLGTENFSSYISNYITAHEDDDPSYDLASISGASMSGSSLGATFVATYSGSSRAIYHTINGESCDGERVRTGSTPTAKKLSTCKHSFTIPEGYTITWYMDPDFTVLPKDNTTTMNIDIVLYGCYTYDMVYGTDSAFYSIPGVGYVQDLTKMSSSSQETEKIIILDGAGVEKEYTLTTTTYYYKVGDISYLAAIVRDHPSLCYTDVSFTWESAGSSAKSFSLDDFKIDGYSFEATNTNNVMSKSGSTVHADLKAFYSRNSYTLKSDYTNTYGSILTKTEYKSYLSTVTVNTPTKENYTFTGWTWEKDNGDEWEDGPSGVGETSVTFLMPNFNVTATANFEPAESSQVINYHYQDKTLRYDDTNSELFTSETISYTPEEEINLGDYLKDKDYFELSSIVIIDNTKSDGNNVYELGKDDTFQTTGSMTIDYYYSRVKTAIEITSEIKTSDNQDHNASIIGGGKYYYEQEATMKLSYVSQGFTFEGWYDGDTLLSKDVVYTFEAKKATHIVAKLSPVAIDEPIISLSGKSTYTYDYETNANNIITASVTFPLNSDSYAYAYKWYEVDDKGNKTLVDDAISTTMQFKTGKDAGTYYYKVVVTGKNEINGRTKEFESEPFEIVVDKSSTYVYRKNYSGIYDGKSHTFNFVVYDNTTAEIYYSSSPLDKDNYTTGSTTKPTFTNAGDYYTYVYVHDVSGNFEDYSKNTPLEVHISKIVVSLKNKGNLLTKTYDGTDVVDAVDINDYVAVSSVSGLTLDSYEAHFNSVHVDDAEVVVFTNMTLSESSAVNYKLADNATISVSGEITPQEIEVTWDDETTFTYDGKAHNIDAKIGKDFTFTKTASKTNAGTYKVELTLASAKSGNLSDYTFDVPSKTMTIKKRDISIAPNEGTFTYDSKKKELEGFKVTSGSLAENQTIGQFTTCDAGKINAGTYDLYARTIQIVQGKLDVTANYNITEDCSTLTINPRGITVSGITALDKVYDATTDANVSLDNIKFTNVLNNDVLSLNPSKVSAEFEQAAPGTDLDVVISIEEGALVGANKDNYKLETESLPSSADITSILVKVTADEVETTYGTLATFTNKMNKTVPGLTGEVTYVIKNSSNTVVEYSETTPVGTYTVVPVVTGISAVGYSFETANGKLTIGKKTISIVEAGSVTKDYDGTTTATIGKTNYTLDGLLTADADKVTLTSIATYDTSEVGTGKTVSLSSCGLTGVSSGNYVLNSNVATFTGGVINKKTVTVKIIGNTSTKTYNGLEQSESGYTFKSDSSLYLDSYTTFTGNSTVTGKVCDSGKSKTYYMGLTDTMFENKNSNFEVTYTVTDGSITISPKTITVKADDKSKTYGDNNPTFTASYSGFANSETTSVISGTPTFSCSATQYSIPTTYAISTEVTGLSANNYVFKAESGVLTVNKKALTISGIVVNNRVYNGNNSVSNDQFDITSMVKGGLCDVDTDLTGLSMSATYDDKNAASNKTVTINLTLSGDLLARYSLSSSTVTTTSTITRADMNVSVKQVTVLYGVTPKYTLVYETLLGDDKETDLGTITVGSDAYTSASGVPGTYAIEVSGPSQSTNYNITYDGSTLIIVEKNILKSAVVSWSNTNIGTITWEEVLAVSGVSVKDYLVTLYKNGKENGNIVDTQIVNNTTFSFNFHDKIIENGEGQYYVRVRANSNNSLLVDDSVPTFSEIKFAARIKAVFGKNGAAGDKITLNSVSGSTGIVLIAGESKTDALTAVLADTYKTGYTMSATTSASTLTLSDTNDDKNGTFTADISLSSAITSSADLTITVDSTARKATLTASMTEPSPSSIEFGYTEEESSVVNVNVDVEASDNITKDDYTYAYEWYLRKNAKEGYKSESIYTSSYTFPVGQIAFGGYRVYCKVTATRNDQLPTAAESKIVTWSGASNPNYYKQIAVAKSTKLNFVAKVTINGGEDWTYDQIAKNLSVSYYDLKGYPYETPDGESIVYEYSDMPSGSTWVSDQPKSAGTWYVRAIVTTDNFADCTSSAQEFVIKQKEVTLNWNDLSLTYNGKEQKPTIVCSGLVGSDKCEATVSGEQVAASETSYTATATKLSNANYKLPEVTTKSFTISPKEVVLSWGNLDLTYDASAQKPTCTVTNKALTTDDVTVTVTPDKTSINADSYVATASITNTNYKLPAVYTKDYTIKPKEVVLSWDNLDLTYNKTEQIPTCTVTNKAQESDDVTVTVTSNKTSINADNYTATAAISNTNYKLPTVYTKAYTIKQKTVTLSWGTDSFIYNGTSQAPVATAGSLETGDTCSVKVVGSQKNAKDTAYTATAESLGNSNYKLPSDVTKEFTISPKEITITWGESDFTYNGKDQAPVATAGLLETGDTCTITVSGAQKNYSSSAYTATASKLSNSNYKLPSAVTKEFTISKKEIGITWGTTTFIYNGSEQKPTATATKVETGDTCTITVTGEQTDVSTTSYTATAASVSNANYKLPSAVTTTFDITPKEVVLSWANTDLTYNKTSQIPTCSVTNKAKETDDVTVTVTSDKESINADSYTATAAISNPNYKLPAVKTLSYTIKPKTVTLSWGTDSFTYNGSEQKPTVTAGLLESGDTCSVTTTGEKIAASSTAYTVTATSLGNSNYKLPSDPTHTFTISPKEITITWGDNEFTYNGKTQAPTATAGLLESGDTCTITVTGGQKDASSTAYTATAASLSNSNYKLPSLNTKTFTISPKEIGITWTNTSLTYNGSNQKPTAQATGLETGDTCTITVSGEQKDAKSSAYTATAASLSNSNYKLPTNVTQEFTISPKEVVLFWSNLDITYNKTAQKPTCTVTNKALSTDDVTVTVTPNKEAINAGDYTATASITNSNYKLPSVYTKDYTIKKKTVTLSWGTDSFTYNGENQKPTVTAGLLESGDTCTVTTTGEKKDASSTAYTVTATSLSNDNYKLPNDPTHKFTISPKEVVLSWDNLDLTYNKTAQKPTCTVTNKALETDDVTVTVTPNKTSINAGDYVATASIANSNYKLPSVYTKDYTIKQKEVSLTWSKTNLTYDGTVQSPVATAGLLESGDTCTVTVTGGKKDASSTAYTATAASLSNANYKLPTAVTQEFTISPKEITITWGNTSFTYDGTKQVPVATAGSLVKGDTCEITVNGSKTNYSETPYTATAASLSNSNYKLPTAVTKEFTIGKKEIGITWANTDLTYNGKAQKPTADATNLVEGDTCTITVIGEQTNAKSTAYTATATELSNSNYKLPTKTTTEFTISPKEIGISWSNKSFTYDGNTHKPTAEATKLIEGDTCTITVSGEKKDVSTSDYTATATKLSNSNYKLPSDVTCGFKITPKEVTLVWSIDEHHIYDGNDYLPTAIAGSLVSGDECEVTTTGAKKNAGTYTVTASSLSNSNYKLPLANTETFTIEQRTITLNWADTSVTYNGKAQCSSATVLNIVTGDTCNISTSASGTHTHVGKYTVTANSVDNANYKLPEVKTTEMTISEKELAVAWDDIEFVFDNTSHKPTAYATNLCGTDTVNITVSGEKINTGIYTATAESIDNNDYKLPSVKPTTQFSIVATIGDYTFTVDDYDSTYDGTEKKPHITVKDGDDVISESEYKVTYTDNIDSGIATATISNVLGNYIVEGETTFPILKREVHMTSNSAEAVYSGKPLTGSSVTETKDGFAENEGAEYSYTTSITDVGTIDNEFTYTLNSNTDEDNYDITTENGTLTIVKAKPVVKLSSKRVNYNGKVFEIEKAAIKLVNNETYDGEVEYTYYSDAKCTKEVSTPSAQGEYYVKAFIDETDNYLSATSNVVTLNIDYTLTISNNGVVIINTDQELILTTNAPLTRDKNGNKLTAVMLDDVKISSDDYKVSGNTVVIGNEFLSKNSEGHHTVTLKFTDKSLSGKVFLTDLYSVEYTFDGKVPAEAIIPVDENIYWYGSEVELDETLSKGDKITSKKTRFFGYYVFEGWQAESTFYIYDQTEIIGVWTYVNTFPWWIVAVGAGIIFFFIIILIKRRKDDDEEEEEEKRKREAMEAANRL